MMFSLLNLISGFLETGAVIFALRSFDVKTALLAALLYQAGNLTPYPVRLSKAITLGLSAAAALLMTAAMAAPLCGILAVPFLSAALQSVRAGMKSEAGKIRKRVLRMAGFLLGFCFTPAAGAVCAAIVACCIRRSEAFGRTEAKLPAFGALQAVMIFHQMHYFSYCYAVMILAFHFGGAALAAGLFFAGWLTYVFAPFLYKNGKNNVRMFLFGHTLLTALLLALYLAPSPPAKAVLWLLTGLGGTTEFCIGRLERQEGAFSKLNHDCAENFGHILGVAVCLAVYALTGDLYLTVLPAAAFALCAMALILTLTPAPAPERRGTE